MKASVRYLLAAMTIAAILLSGCTPEPTEAPTMAPTEPPATEAPTEEPTEPPEPVTIVYWSMWNESELQGQVLSAAITDYEAANPHVTVEAVWNGRTNRELVGPALDGGEQIDVFDTGDEYIFANLGQYVLPLDDMLDDPAVGVDGKTVRQTLMPGLLGTFPVDGNLAIIPYQPYAVLWFYNQDHFDEVGATIPTTWDELRDVCQAVTDAGYGCITTDVDAYLDILWGYYSERAFGGCQAGVDAMNDETGESWNDPMWMQLATDFYGLAQDGYVDDSTAGNLYPAGQQALALGEVTMYLNGTWLPTEVLDTAGSDFNWGSFSFPDVADGGGSATHVMMGSQGLVVTAASENPTEAWGLIKTMVGLDAQQAMVDTALVPAAHTDVVWTGDLEGAYNAVAQADMSISWGCDIWTSEVSGVLLDLFGQLLVGDITPEEYTAELVQGTADYWAGQEETDE